MTDPRDQLEDWLSTEVTPLSPPPGTLDRIRRRARQRKVRHAVVASAVSAVVLAAGASVPTLISNLRSGGARPPVAAGSTPAAIPPAPGPSASSSASVPAPDSTGQPTQLNERTTLSTTTSGTVPPPHFRPTSVTFVGNGAGGSVGAVIGQAGPPCATDDCTSLAGTSDYGKSWYGVSAPIAPGPDGDTGVSQLRFLDLHDGWAFGPALYETTSGGWPWTQENTDGQRVIDLEAAGHDALAVFATCSGSGADYAADCTSFALYGSTAGSTTWSPVAVPAAFADMSTGQPASASLVIAGGTTGYLLAPSGAVLTGPVAGGTWTQAGQAPCQPGRAQASGAPSGAQLAALPGLLLLTCATPSGSGAVFYTSPDGAQWTLVTTVPAAGAPTSLASAAASEVVLATTAGIYYSSDGGATWQAASVGGATPGGGFSYVGMTNATQGVAVPADANLGGIYVTADGGKTWTLSPIAS